MLYVGAVERRRVNFELLDGSGTDGRASLSRNDARGHVVGGGVRHHAHPLQEIVCGGFGPECAKQFPHPLPTQ